MRACTAVMAAALTVFLSFGESGAQRATRRYDAREVIDGVSAAYASMAKLPALDLEYLMVARAASENSYLKFAWGEVKVRHVTEGPKRYFEAIGKGVAHPAWPHSKPLDIRSSWDQVTGRQLDEDFLFSVSETSPVNFAIYAFYFQHLFSESVVDAHWRFASARKKIDPDAYALPRALLSNRDAYRLLARRERIEDDWCVILERPGVDKLWVCPDKGFCLKQREFWWKPGGPLRERTRLLRHELRGGAWMPMKTVKEFFSPPWYAGAQPGDLALTQTVTVTKAEVTDVDDALFRSVVPPVGASVYDGRTGAHFTLHEADYDPFVRSLAEARALQPRSGRVVALCAGIILSCALLVYFLRRLMRATR